MGLLLTAADIAAPLAWRWLLSDEETGELVAAHQVNLEAASAEVSRFGDLYGYARSYSAPDRRVADGARIAAEAGAWAGRALLGESVAAAIAAAAPVTVRVRVPGPAASVLLWPLELAHHAGRPLARRGDVAFVYDIGGGAAATADDAAGRDGQGSREGDPGGAALRLLAVFSQPTKTSVLALRRERYALTRLIRRVAARERAAVELRVVQYGVTRERLAEIAESGGGWDVLHLSGHGAGGLFLLEKADGSADPVSPADLVDLLRPARRRVKLAVASACESAADTTAQTLRLIGLDDQADALEAAEAAAGRQGAPVPGLARALVSELGCAVVAMRYPVTDEFAMGFADVLYERLLSRRQSVDVAVARATAQAAGPAPSASRPALSLATPGAFGPRAAGLRLSVPRGMPLLDPARQRMAFFPDEPERFVGRLDVMAQAGAALAPGSGRPGVLLHGMAGGGKTACALELAYRHQDSFAAAAFWRAPTRADEGGTALADFANRMEMQLGDYGFTLAAHIGTEAMLAAFLPRLRELRAASGLLIVLDNLETLLTPAGTWLDPRWGLLLTALAGPGGASRVVMTSRMVPAGLDGERGGGRPGRLVTLPVHALSLNESVALARELPNLRALLHADPGPLRAATVLGVNADRDRVLRVLRVVQGHPKLLELADAAARSRETLDAQLAAAEAAAAQRRLEAFFREGTSGLDPGQFLAALSEWTTTALAALPEPARLMAEFLACLEDRDLISYVIERNWKDLHRRLNPPGDPPPSLPLLNALAAAALIEPAPAEPGTPAADGTPDGMPPAAYRMHPGVAAAIAAAARPGLREATDAELAAFWTAAAHLVAESEGSEGGEKSWLMVQAGLSAAPYLLRRGEWHTAVSLLDQALRRDGSPGTAQAALPALRRAAAASGTPEAAGVLARALSAVNPPEAERRLRAAVAGAAAAGDYRAASGIAGELVTALMNAGRLEEALDVARHKADYTGRASPGPWTLLADQTWLLQLMVLKGDHGQVLAKVTELRAAMAGLPDPPAADEAVTPWNVREVILDTGHSSALATGDWERCLELNAEITASRRQRGAGAYEVTLSRFNDAAPLIRLGRLGEAQQLLCECQDVAEEEADTALLAKILTIRAVTATIAGDWQAAADLERAALRLCYARPEAEDIAISHHNLASYLGELGDDRTGQRAHRLAAALILMLAGLMYELAGTVRVLAAELRETPDEDLPSTVARVVEAAELTEGVRLGALLASLEPYPQVAEEALTRLLSSAAGINERESPASVRYDCS